MIRHADLFGDRLGQRFGDWVGPWVGDHQCKLFIVDRADAARVRQ